MASLLNENRPPAFCHGCSHDLVLYALDKAFANIGLAGTEIIMVSDIGCSGLFDTFWNTHALHGLHGRALTYAAGIKLAQPKLNVVVTMGDGGLGIGGAHLLEACRRNLDMTLLILNNFNFGMTGGQFSATTPPKAKVGSGFLNRIERPMDPGSVAVAAGAPYVVRVSAHEKTAVEEIEKAIQFKGFSVVDLWGVCPGRYLKGNRLNPKMIKEEIDKLPPLTGLIEANQRSEYSAAYREESAVLPKPQDPVGIEKRFEPLETQRQEVVFLGAAGGRVQTAAGVLGIALLTAGLNITQKSEYNITVMTGPSISELIVSLEPVDYNGIQSPNVVVALAQEGVTRRQAVFGKISEDAFVIKVKGIDIPHTKAKVMEVDFKAQKLKKTDWAMAALTVMAKMNKVLTMDMLQAATAERFKGSTLDSIKTLIDKVAI